MKVSCRMSGLICVMLFLSHLSMAEEKQEKSTVKIPTDKKKFHIFILMGQSNMSGYAPMLPEDKKPVPNVLKLPTVGEMKWVPAAHPLHNRLGSDGFGLGIPFATEYIKKNPGVVVGLIPLGWGGMGIDTMNKGTAVYKDAIEKAEFAMKQGTIKGVLWHQGENDTVTQELADSYEKKLHKLISDIRKDLKNEQLPFVVGNLAEFYGTFADHAPRIKLIDQVRAILRNVPKKVKNTGFVESKDCTSVDGNNVHFDRKSYIILGTRYAAECDKLIKKTKNTPAESEVKKAEATDAAPTQKTNETNAVETNIK